MFGIGGRQAGSGFIHKKHLGLADEFQGDVQSFALAATDKFIQGRSHLQVACFIESEFFEEGCHNLMQMLRIKSVKAKSCIEPKVLIYNYRIIWFYLKIFQSFIKISFKAVSLETLTLMQKKPCSVVMWN